MFELSEKITINKVIKLRNSDYEMIIGVIQRLGIIENPTCDNNSGCDFFEEIVGRMTVGIIILNSRSLTINIF